MKGFSLVELSIVLVILGLLTGGILAGQNLIRASELRAVTTEYTGYVTAVQTFRDKYFALPGDMRNAEDFWGTMATGTCPNATAGTGTQTCNGDGNGQIVSSGSGSQASEMFMFWKQLANAGLIEGSYTGLSGSGGNRHAVIGENVPNSKLGQGGWTLRYVGNYAGDGNTYAMNAGHMFHYGAAVANQQTYGRIMSPEEAWNVDTKVDDGRPAHGQVFAMYRGNLASENACTINAASATDFDSDYHLTNTGTACALYFIRAF